MKNSIKSHPAVVLGRFIKNKRIDNAALTGREFAMKMGIMPSDASNLEFGIGDNWHIISDNKLIEILKLKDDDLVKFYELRKNVGDRLSRMGCGLTLSDVFDREELRPIFLPLDKQELILNHLFGKDSF